MKSPFLAGAAAATALAALGPAAAAAQARDQIRIVGSSTVFPYTQAVAEQFAGLTGFSAPVVESTGTGGGMQIFCGGLGPEHPDITGASRAMTESEYETCQANGVDSVTEILLGYDGLSIAHSTSGTRDAFVELVMHEGCEAFPAIAALDEARKEEVCERMRQDGPFIEAGENDNLIVQRLDADPHALGIFGYSFLFENSDKLKPVAIDGVAPNEETIASGEYAVSRPLFIYVKNAHRGVIPGLDEFLAEYVSEEAFGPDGYLPERGLIPLGDEERDAVRAAVEQGAEIDRFN
jgi:phosphate transport system substrate-binding protein